jgi:acetyl-CoA C-acetyltransferase
MASHGIKDRVAIIGAGCIPFREHWDKSTDDMLIEAADAAFKSAGVTKHDVDAYWLGTAQSGMAGITLAIPLKLHNKPVTRVENFCATGSEAMRNAAYALASGAYDMVMAIGVEKVKDSGYQGLNASPIPNDGTASCSPRTLTSTASTKTSCAWRSPASLRRTTTTAPATRVRSSARRCRPRRSARWRPWPDA